MIYVLIKCSFILLSDEKKNKARCLEFDRLGLEKKKGE